MSAEKELVVVHKLDNAAIWHIALNRPTVRNAVDYVTGQQLAHALIAFDKDTESKVAVLSGNGGYFCAGADLQAAAGLADDPARAFKVTLVQPAKEVREDGADYDTTGVMGFSRLTLTKPVIAAVQGFAVAGGLELACWCDMRVAEENAVFGVFCRRWGVPLIDGGTVRLPRLIGHSRAMDMILTGRPVSGAAGFSTGISRGDLFPEALMFGLANRIVPKGQAIESAIELARSLTQFPQKTMRSDRMAAIQGWSEPVKVAMGIELERAKNADDIASGAQQFAVKKVGRGGDFSSFSAKL